MQGYPQQPHKMHVKRHKKRHETEKLVNLQSTQSFETTQCGCNTGSNGLKEYYATKLILHHTKINKPFSNIPLRKKNRNCKETDDALVINLSKETISLNKVTNC